MQEAGVGMLSLLDEVKDIKIHYLDEISSQIVIEEDQNSLEANARKKQWNFQNIRTGTFLLQMWV